MREMFACINCRFTALQVNQKTSQYTSAVAACSVDVDHNVREMKSGLAPGKCPLILQTEIKRRHKCIKM